MKDNVGTKTDMDIYSMQFPQVTELHCNCGKYLPIFQYVMRVPSGWIYANYDTDKEENL